MALHGKMPDPTSTQLSWIRNRAIPHKIFENGKGKAWCSKCGSDIEVPEGTKSMTCPHCGARLPLDRLAKRENGKRKFEYHGDIYAQFLTICHGYQIIRYYSVEWKSKRGAESTFTFRLVMEKWCQPGRPTVTLGVPVVMLPGWCRIPYSHNGSATIKSAASWWYSEWMYVKVYPRMRLLSVYKKTVRNARYFAQICAEDLLAIIYSNPYFESLYKAGKTEELKGLIQHVARFNKYWPSIRVALRHGFKPSNWNDYLDYLAMLALLRKDMRSPHYVAPTDWGAMHGLICTQARNKRLEMERRREEREAIRRAEEEARREEERRAARKSFPKRIAKFKDLWIVGYGLEIRPLMTIEEFAEEGNAMGHCVFSRAYYKNANSLIMSARDASTNKRVETIEVDLTRLVILQSRGHGNVPSDRHNDVLALVNGAMPKIDALAHPRRKTPIRVSPARS